MGGKGNLIGITLGVIRVGVVNNRMSLLGPGRDSRRVMFR